MFHITCLTIDWDDRSIIKLVGMRVEPCRNLSRSKAPRRCQRARLECKDLSWFHFVHCTLVYTQVFF